MSVVPSLSSVALDTLGCDVCFFFSSRRRHTSSLCDWSSDVCSSDLPQRTCPQAQLTSAQPVCAACLLTLLANATVAYELHSCGVHTTWPLALTIFFAARSKTNRPTCI